MSNKYGDHRDQEMEPEPSEEDLEWWVFDSVCEATDGCQVEPDGECPHGHLSWLRFYELI